MINLIPDSNRINNRFALRNTRLIRYTAVSIFTMLSIVIITALSILSMNSTVSNLQKQATSESKQLETYKPLQAQGKQLSDQLTTINTLLNRQVNFSTMLPQIAKIMPPGAVLKQLDFNASDILPAGSVAGAVGSPTPTASSNAKPFVILAAVKDRSVAATLLENIKASKDLFIDADIVSVNQDTKANPADANTLPSISVRYPYQVTINAYLKKLNPQKSAATSSTSTGGTQ